MNYIRKTLKFLDIKVILLVSLYETGDTKRNDEFIECLNANLKVKEISHVIVLYETSYGYDLLKRIPETVSVVYIDHRVTYDDFFEKANLFKGNVIIANSDVYFKKGLNKVVGLNLKNKLVVVTRYNELNGVLHSQSVGDITACADAWIFRAPTTMKCSCMLGVPYCDGKVSAYAYMDGYDVVNYSKDIVIVHRHNKKYVNNKRSMRDYKGQSLYVQMTHVNEKPDVEPKLISD